MKGFGLLFLLVIVLHGSVLGQRDSDEFVMVLKKINNENTHTIRSTKKVRLTYNDSVSVKGYMSFLNDSTVYIDSHFVKLNSINTISHQSIVGVLTSGYLIFAGTTTVILGSLIKYAAFVSDIETFADASRYERNNSTANSIIVIGAAMAGSGALASAITRDFYAVDWVFTVQPKS